ncbi:nucleoside 2-deoxyribosyltransferase [Conexibacter stalactiti]|uniref:Nucleoside 2-deoxyribosyltransferase n=1 Tax=Conexibacter stalactiti TaxID=1940611 RepID=A0ABU4HZ93_9ACTN|nr:nucleoside 2-deoxyribosyltransferase [Conexibacter stalactiti]MDW5598637.1 nucleoside 2-deoxyribosyltransferase [Conexibacter stalactiti]MEC5039279.1 nucleoside 2-deoxyribosyltransferase [Conexibacter stalactiti]
MAPLPRCYVASPLGFNEAGAHYYRAVYLPALARVVEPLDPWAHTEPAEIERARAAGTLRALWLATGRKNLELIRSAPLLVAWLDGQEVDSGTATEIGYAAGVGVRCFGLRSDVRHAGEEEMAVNLQVETTIEVSGGRVVGSLEELVAELRGAALP